MKLTPGGTISCVFRSHLEPKVRLHVRGREAVLGHLNAPKRVPRSPFAHNGIQFWSESEDDPNAARKVRSKTALPSEPCVLNGTPFAESRAMTRELRIWSHRQSIVSNRGISHQVSVLLKSTNLILILHLEEMQDRLPSTERVNHASLLPCD
jgi:hypothetical protein